MATINVNNGKGDKKNKPEKQVLRVDFTPMVDMNMLLITFFMFCTTLSLPQVMNIAMPADGDGTPAPETSTLTVLLGKDNKMYYYAGKPNYDDYTSLKEVDMTDFRNLMLERNDDCIDKMKVIKDQRRKKQISESDFKAQASEFKKAKGTPTVIIKPTKDSNYKNLVDVLDEMQICSVGKYVIVDVEDADKFLLQNYTTKGSLTALVQ